MGRRPTRGDESQYHPERSEGSAGPVQNGLMQILRCAQNDRLSGAARDEESRAASKKARARFFAPLGMTRQRVLWLTVIAARH